MHETNAGGYLELAALNKSLSAVGAVHAGIGVTLSPQLKSSNGAERVSVGQFTSGVLPALNVAPELGRWFQADDMEAGRDDIIILSDAVWRRQFGADPNVLGRRVFVDGTPVTIVGVMPPAFRLLGDHANAMRRSSRTVSRLGSRFQNGFVIAQIAIGVILLCAAGLMVRGLLQLRGADLGLDPANVMSFQIRWPITNSVIRQVGTTPNEALEVKLTPTVNTATHALIRRIDEISGIEGAAASVYPPLSGETRLIPMALEGRSLRGSDAGAVTTQWYPVSPEFFAVTRMRLKRGRSFNTEDRRSDAAPVAIVNETAAERLFGGANAVGRYIQLGIFGDKPRRIVGVVPYVRQSQFASGNAPQLYVPRSQVPLQIDGTSGYAK